MTFVIKLKYVITKPLHSKVCSNKNRCIMTAHTIVNLPDRLIRKKFQANSGEPGMGATNVVSFSRKRASRGPLPGYVRFIRVSSSSSSEVFYTKP